MLHRLTRFVILSAAAAALSCTPAVAATGDLHVAFPDAVGVSAMSATAAVVGDVDGDGLADSAVSVPAAHGGTVDHTVWVTFAAASTPSSVSAGQAGWHGFSITGAPGVNAIAGVEDLNGDGRREIALALDDGRTVVVYGQPDGTAIDLTALGAQGFTIQNTTGQALETGSSGGDFLDGHTVASLGDQDGDGRADLAVVTATGAAVVRSPAPGGTVDASAAGADRLLNLADGGGSDVRLGSLGDLDGDGRADLAVFWQGADGAPHAAGVAGSATGATADLLHAADGGHGFLLDGGAGDRLRDAVTLGDQDGDGRRDLALDLLHGGRRGYWRVTTPAFGTHGALDTGSRGVADVFSDELVAIGDVDGDHVEDTASGVGLQLSTLLAARPGGQPYPIGTKVIGSVPDRSGDGRAEPVGLHADPFTGIGPGLHEAAYQLDTLFGQPTPVTFVPGGGPLPDTPNPCQVVPAACVAPAPPKAVPAPAAVVKHVGKKLTGTKKNDKLTGTAYADVLKGMGGNDTIKGLGGNDTIDGGSGPDRIDAGAGDDHIAARDGAIDTINCGPGKDTVVADRGDKLTGCEKVSRPKAVRHKKHR